MTTKPTALQSKFAATRKELAAALIERDDEIDLALTALVAQEHVLLVGPPGTGKSLLLDSILRWTGGKQVLDRCSRSSRCRRNCSGRCRWPASRTTGTSRITTGRMPEADFAFVDEIFKASSAILNTLLKLLNERTFDNGDGVRRKVPLKLCVAASNEWPSPETAKELGALFDRFIFRKTVKPIVSASGRKRLLWERDHTPKLSHDASAPDEIVEAHRRGDASSPWTDAGEGSLRGDPQGARQAGHPPRRPPAVQGRRCGAGVRLGVRCGSGRDRAPGGPRRTSSGTIPIEQPAVCAKVVAAIANPVGMRVNQLLLEVETILAGDRRAEPGAGRDRDREAGRDRQAVRAMKGNGRLDRARTYVRAEVKKLKLASIESI